MYSGSPSNTLLCLPVPNHPGDHDANEMTAILLISLANIVEAHPSAEIINDCRIL
jgi:hypothetical protein